MTKDQGTQIVDGIDVEIAAKYYPYTDEDRSKKTDRIEY